MGSTRHCHILSEDFFSIIHPQGVASFDPRGLIGRIYEGDYWKLLLIKYISCGPNGFRRRFSKFFPSYKLMGALCFPLSDEHLHEISSHLAD